MVSIMSMLYNDKPYWTNPENGMEWHIDKSTTEYANSTVNGKISLNAIAFLVVKDKKPFGRVLVSKETNEVIADDQALEGIGCKIDVLKLLKSEK